MALPPTIPTSFVPHASGTPQKFRSDFTGAFGLFAYTVLGIVFALALGVFLYGRLLAGNLAAKDAEVEKSQKAIDQSTVESFVRLRNRLNQGQVLLEKHVAFSGLFSSLGTLLPSTVRFSTLHVLRDSAGVSKIEGTGVAKSFNALAAVSTAFAEDGRIKDAIFSKITVNKDNSVSFGLTATLDPKLVAFSAETATAPARSAETASTASTSSPQATPSL